MEEQKEAKLGARNEVSRAKNDTGSRMVDDSEDSTLR